MDSEKVRPVAFVQQLRRFLVLASWAFAFGGFVFYASVVVPIGTDQLDSTTQGFITRRVTNVLNLAALVAVVLFVWQWWAEQTRRSKSASGFLLAMISIVAGCCALLIWLHGKMDGMLAPDQLAVLDDQGFYQWHRVYLWASTLQWLASLPILWMFSRDP